MESNTLLSAVVQFFKSPSDQTLQPPIVSFKIAQVKSSIDPLLLQWLRYRVTYYKVGTFHPSVSDIPQNTVETTNTSSDTATRKKTFPSLHESVHSSSDRERKKSAVSLDKSKATSKIDEPKKIVTKSEDRSETEVNYFYQRINERNTFFLLLLLH